jgi:hypothetical protein
MNNLQKKSSFNINLDNKPNLRRAMHENTRVFKEVVGTFVDLMEEAFDENKGIPWYKLPSAIHEELSFRELVAGVLHGTLDVDKMNPELFSALKVEAHPLAMLSPRKDAFTGELRLRNWRQHFRQSSDAVISEQTIANILRTILRHTRYVDIKKLAEAMDTNQEMTFRGLGTRVAELLPMRPALEYQRELKGDLFVGTFNLETGGLDCGETAQATTCLACKKTDVATVGNHVLCYVCNASFKLKGDNDNAEPDDAPTQKDVD